MSTIKITFVDGSATETRLTARSLVRAERHYGADVPNFEGNLYAAWGQVAPDVDFETWLDTVDSVEKIAPDPTEASPSTD